MHREKKNLLLQLLLGSLSKASACQQRGGVLLAKASSSRASGEQRIPAAASQPGRGAVANARSFLAVRL